MILMDYESDLVPEETVIEVIKSKSLVALFQPIVSVVKKKVIGMEGLIRGINPLSGEYISPLKLFEVANLNCLTLELDRACRYKCIESFASLYLRDKNLKLFLNVDSSIIEQAEGSNYLLNQVLKSGIAPSNVVIEINESRVIKIEPLIKFVNTYRDYGFLIALDDLGTGFSNLDRISVLKPDIIKLDRSLISNVKESKYNQEVFKGLIGLASRIGSLVVAEGVETGEEMLLTLEFGAHLLQGFFISKPQILNSKSLDIYNQITADTASSYKHYMKNKITAEKQILKKMDITLSNIIFELVTSSANHFDDLLTKYLVSDYGIECAYILDEKGIQVSATVCDCGLMDSKKCSMFIPADKGSDHSLKKYYYQLVNARMNKYITEPYISLATGSRCITVSKTFRDLDHKKFILCLDFIRV